MNKEQFEEVIKTLSTIKDEWNEKFDELMELVKEHNPTADEKELQEFIEKLDSTQTDLKGIGVKYKEELKAVVSEMDKEASDPIISKLCDQVIDNIDHDYARYQGVREKRLRDINEIIEMYKGEKRS